MHLKRLEMIGFKSFADKTVVEFDKGVSAIVGPNGCGKSNISDAIRWVLGEKSYKMLRGGKMGDMIFNGTELRKPMGYCEVSMVFSNEDRMLPVEFSEVAVTRKYYREGQSEFFINRTPCRQKDIYDLLMDTGIGSNSYCMVEQGRIDYIVRASADERRFLIEEAAGISKYKSKKEEAMRKLNRTENNLLRINDIVAEVEKNIKYAERQARKAERFRERYDQLKKLETYRAFEEIDELKKNKTDFESKKNLLESRQGALQESVAAIQRQVQEQSQEIEALNEMLSQKEGERYQLMSECDKLKSKVEFNMIRSSELKARNDQNQRTVEETEEKIALNRESVAQKEAEYAAFQQEKSEIEAEFQAKQEALVRMTEEIEAIRAEVLRREQEYELCAAQIAQVKKDADIAHIEISKLENQVKRIEAEIEKLLSQKAEHETTLIGKQEVLDQQRTEFSAFIEQYEKMKASRVEREKELESVRTEVLNKRVVHKEVEARLRVLEELEKNYSGFKDGAKAALQRKDEQDPLFQSLSTLVSVLDTREGYENAIQAILADRIYSVVAGSHREALDIIKYLNEHNLGQVTILVNRQDVEQDDVAIPYEPGFILGRAIDFVTVTDENRAIMKELFKRTLIISNAVDAHYDEIVELSRQFRLVTRDGMVIGPNIYISGGSESENNAEILTRDRKIKELRQRMDDLAREQRALSSHEGNLTAQVEELRIGIEQQERLMYDHKVKIETSEQVSQSMKSLAERIMMEIELLQKERAEAESSIATTRAEKESCEHKLQDYEATREQCAEARDAEKQRLQDMIPQREQAQMDSAALQAKINGVAEKDTFMANAIQSLKDGIEHDTRTIERIQHELTENEESIDQLQQESAGAQEQVNELENGIRQMDLELTRMHSDRDDATIKLHSIQDEVAGATTELENCREEVHELSMKIMDLSYRENALHDRLLQTYKIELNDIDRTSIELDEKEKEQLGSLILDLSSKVESMGAVNLMAIEEFDSLKERYEFLAKHRDDLEQARTTLLEAIRKINRTTRKLFVDVFNQVKVNFNDYYTTLFKGGHAELTMVDPENPLESGIDIFVRPPGKKLQNISLLSGGEKALTAIALLFACFKVKPSPYCLLDEVDAPLDEANIDRFLTVLQDFLTTSQFLIVTHNRKTIKMADTLFGITMEEAGVSKVVSVKMGDEDQFIDKKEISRDKRQSIYKPKKNYNTEKLEALVGE